ncbi:MAG: sigma-70 family RNA polymerase sigma factor [Bacteroidota bacterium]
MSNQQNKIALENQIVRLLGQGEQQAISLLYQNYSGALLGIISRMIPSREVAEEVLQDVFVKVWDNADKYDPAKGKLFTWLAQITRNTALDKVRSAGYRKGQKTDEIETNVSVHEQQADDPAIEDSGLRKVIGGLDKNYRTLIDYAYFQSYSQSEIAKELGMPLGTVKSRMRAAIKELRKILKDELISILILFGL